MKKLLLVIAILVTAGAANASLFTMDFANSTLDLGAASQIDLTNQYSTFGLTFDHVYRYADRRDPWDEQMFGISNGNISQNFEQSATGIVYFSELTNYVAFDWWTFEPSLFYLDAYAADDSWLGGGLLGNGQGQSFLSFVGIDHIRFHNGGGQASISTLTYERTGTVPEPATMLLVGLGMAGIGIIRRKRS